MPVNYRLPLLFKLGVPRPDASSTTGQGRPHDLGGLRLQRQAPSLLVVVDSDLDSKGGGINGQFLKSSSMLLNGKKAIDESA